MTKTMIWEEGQMFPSFSAPKGKLNAITKDMLNEEEIITVSCLQGLINANETRLVILDSDVETWLKDYGFSFTKIDSSAKRFEVFKEYVKELASGNN